MSWPWNELGLDGPASLSEVRHAYAERTRVLHPEEDPEGFQRLHQAYQEARRLARSSQAAPPPEEPSQGGPQTKPPVTSRRSTEPEASQSDLHQEEGTQASKNGWDFHDLLGEDAPMNSEEKAGWDYEQLFMEERQKREQYIRHELQHRLGLEAQCEDWDDILAVIDQLRILTEAEVPPTLLHAFLKSDLFERVVHSPYFLEVLKDWLDTRPPLGTEGQAMLLSRIRFFFGEDTAPYREIYRRAMGKEIPVTPTKRVRKTREWTQAIFIILFFTAIWGILSLISYNLPASKAERRDLQLAKHLSQDIGMAVSPSDKEGTFTLDLLPEFSFQAEPAGERDLENGEPGYITNFSDMIVFFRLWRFSQSIPYCRLSRSRENDLSPGSTVTNAYGLDIPLQKAPEFCDSLSEFLEKLSREPWYDTFTPHVQIDLERCGGSYFTLMLPEDTFDAEETAKLCVEQIPLKLCIFLMNESGLTKEDLDGRDCDLVELDIFDPEGSPFWQFAAVDVQTKDVIRVYAYSDLQTTLISYPPDKFSQDLTFVELRAKSENFSSSGIVDISKPQIYRYAE